MGERMVFGHGGMIMGIKNQRVIILKMNKMGYGHILQKMDLLLKKLHFRVEIGMAALPYG